ncbi:MAG: hypothetical protein ABI587_10660 [Gemmatimonadales bacterium]
MVRISLLISLGALVLACHPASPRARSPVITNIVVGVSDSGITAPDTIVAGWTRVQLVPRRPHNHNVVVFRLPPEMTATAFARAMDTAAATIAGAVALGGPEMPPPEADTSAMLLHLTPGRYLLGCVLTHADHHRHLLTGEMRWLEVVAGPDAVPDSSVTPTDSVTLVDFAVGVAETLTPGPHRLVLVNAGTQDHHLVVERLRPGKSLADWVASTDTAGVSQGLGGATRISPGQAETWEVSLTPGIYVFFCLVPERTSRKPHAELGMIRQITVD